MLRVRRSPTAGMQGCRAQVCNPEHGSDIRELQLSADGADDEHFSASAMQIRACGAVNGSEWEHVVLLPSLWLSSDGGADWAPLGV